MPQLTIKQKVEEISLDERQKDQILVLMQYAFAAGIIIGQKGGDVQALVSSFHYWTEEMKYESFAGL